MSGDSIYTLTTTPQDTTPRGITQYESCTICGAYLIAEEVTA